MFRSVQRSLRTMEGRAHSDEGEKRPRNEVSEMDVRRKKFRPEGKQPLLLPCDGRLCCARNFFALHKASSCTEILKETEVTKKMEMTHLDQDITHARSSDRPSSPLLYSCLLGHKCPFIADILVSSSGQGKNCEARNGKGVRPLLAYGEEVNTKTDSPLHVMSSYPGSTGNHENTQDERDCQDVFKTLFSSGEEVNIEEDCIWRPLIDTLQNYIQLRNYYSDFQNTIDKCHDFVIRMMINNGHGVNCGKIDDKDWTPLHLKILDSNSKLVESRLLKFGVDTNIFQNENSVPLHQCCRFLDNEWQGGGTADGVNAAHLLISTSGSSVNSMHNKNHRLPLHLSEKFGGHAALYLLSHPGTHVNIPGECFSYSNHPSVAKFLNLYQSLPLHRVARLPVTQ